jgi:hypothetical protein
MRFLAEAHPTIYEQGQWPRLTAHASACEGMDVFRTVVQRFDPPKR